MELLTKPVFAKECSGYSSWNTGGTAPVADAIPGYETKQSPDFENLLQRKHQKIEMKKAFPLRANGIMNGQIMNLISK